jgi:hypothetical protein
MPRRLLTLALLLSCLAVIVQPAFGQDVMIGAKGGLNIANIDTDEPDFDSSTRTGIVAGAFVSFGLTDMFYLQPEVLFSQKGFSQEESGADLTAELDYFQIPVLLKAVFPIEDSPIRPGVYAGGAISFESSCEVSGEMDGVSVSADCDAGDLELEREKTDFGVVFGAEVQYDAGSFTILLDGRYDLGLRDLDKDEELSTKSRTWSFMAGVGFPLN